MARIFARWTMRLGLGSPAAWRFFLRYVRQHRVALAVYSVAATLPAVTIILVLKLIRLAFDVAIPRSNVRLLVLIGLAIVGIRLATTGIALALRRYIVRLTKTTIAAMRADLLSHLYRVERAALTRSDIDRLQTDVVQDTERLDVLFGSVFSGMLPAACTVLALLLFLLFVQWQLVVIAALAAPVVWRVGRWTQQRVIKHLSAFQSDFQRFNRGVSFILRQMDLTRTQAFQQQELTKQQNVVRDLAGSGEQMAWSFALHGQLQGMATGTLGILLLVVGGLQVMRGSMSLGEFLAFYTGASMLGGSILTLTRGSADVGAMGVSLERLATLDAVPPAAPYGGLRRIDFHGQLELRRVDFSYGDLMVLRGADFSASPGEHVAVIGPNGSGKTTLLHLLLGMLRPQRGTALADSVPYEELDLDYLRRHIGVVLQRTALFHGSVRANIAYGEPNAELADVQAAAKLAFADEFIHRLPEGYDTVIGEGGLSLSGGESQRITLARSMLRHPRVLVLDEPTNHLDASVVANILRNLKNLQNSPTIVIVSHDPRIMNFVDRAYRLADCALSPWLPEAGVVCIR